SHHSSASSSSPNRATPFFNANTQNCAPHKRPLTNQTNPNLSYSSASSSSISLSKSPTLSNSLHQYPFSTPQPLKKTQFLFNFPTPSATKAATYRLLRRLHHLRRVRIHLCLVLLLSLPFFYFLVSHPSHSFLLDFISAFAFSAVLLFSLNLVVPRLPSIRLFLARSFPINLSSSTQESRPPLPVFWSIGSRQKSEKRVDSGIWVQVYSNGDVYEGEFQNQ
ncbi:hypothetical protein U1Q18_016304, partial [Sarracenia purpurea var. burkii]